MPKSVDNLDTYELDEYSSRTLKVIPKYKTYIRKSNVYPTDSRFDRIRLLDTNTDYLYLCCVCGAFVIHSNDGLYADSTIEDDNNYYVIPYGHVQCQYMFNLNPLAYEQ